METPILGAVTSSPPIDEKKIVGVRFMPVGKVYHFDATRLADLRQGDWVLVTTSRGRQIGEVATLNPPKHGEADGPFKAIERIATNRDLALKKHWEGQEISAMVFARERAKLMNVPVKITKAEYTFDGSRLTFLYTVEEEANVNIDPLLNDLQKAYRSKVELRLIGPRDAAKIIGGGGACGLTERCCTKFLTDFSPISVKMAKEQGLSLNPQEITGMCGRLRCCLLYEYEQYVDARKLLPKRNKEVMTPSGRGKVIEVLPLKDSVLVQVMEMRIEVKRADLQPLAELEAFQKKIDQPCSGQHGCSCGASKRTGKHRDQKDQRDRGEQKPPTGSSSTSN